MKEGATRFSSDWQTPLSEIGCGRSYSMAGTVTTGRES